MSPRSPATQQSGQSRACSARAPGSAPPRAGCPGPAVSGRALLRVRAYAAQQRLHVAQWPHSRAGRWELRGRICRALSNEELIKGANQGEQATVAVAGVGQPLQKRMLRVARQARVAHRAARLRSHSRYAHAGCMQARASHTVEDEFSHSTAPAAGARQRRARGASARPCAGPGAAGAG